MMDTEHEPMTRQTVSYRIDERGQALIYVRTIETRVLHDVVLSVVGRKPSWSDAHFQKVVDAYCEATRLQVLP